MSEGRPGDHPVTDMLLGMYSILGKEGDELLRTLVEVKGLSFTKTWFEQNIYQQVYSRDEKIMELQLILKS